MIEVNIKKRLGRFFIDIDFELKGLKGVIFGASGSGKSSLLKMIAGFYDPDEGEIRLNSKLFFSSSNRISLSIQRRNVGYLPQEYTLFPNMTVRENIEYGLKKRKMRDELGVKALAKRFGIYGQLDMYPHQISGGQKQRAALARALIVKPDILLLDEPFSALDRPVREDLRELVSDIVNQLGIPVLFVTHDLEEAFVFADEVVIVKNGKVVEFGEKSKVFNSPQFVDTAFLVDFCNIWEIESFKEENVRLKNGIEISCKPDKRASFCCIKPENVMILREDVDVSDKENKIRVTINKIRFRGRYVNIVATTRDGVDICINIPPHVVKKMGLREGMRILVSLKSESLVFCRRLV